MSVMAQTLQGFVEHHVCINNLHHKHALSKETLVLIYRIKLDNFETFISIAPLYGDKTNIKNINRPLTHIMEQLKHIDCDIQLSLKDNTAQDEDVTKLVTCVREQWKQSDIEVKLLSGGFLNSVYKVWSNKVASDAIGVKIFTRKTRDFSETETQMLSMRVAEAAGCGVEVLASFTNGLIYRFAPGEVMDRAKSDSPALRRVVAMELAKLHHMDVPEGETAKSPRMFDDARRILPQFPESFGQGEYYLTDDEHFGSKGEFEKELGWLERKIQQLHTDIVFGHGDMWWGNIIYDENTGGVTLVDYDLAGYNPMTNDLARFISAARFYLSTCKMEYLTEMEEKDFLRAYLNKRLELKGRDSSVADKYVDKLYGQTMLLKLWAAAYKILVTYSLHHYTKETEMLQYARTLHHSYNKYKLEYLEYVKNKPIQGFSVNDI